MLTLTQERRKLDLQQAAEAEAARTARASLLRRNLQKANQKLLLEAERQKSKGSFTAGKEFASQALLAAVRCPLSQGDQCIQGFTDVSCAASTDRGLSNGLSHMSNDDREGVVAEPICRQHEQTSRQHRLTADHILVLQGRSRPASALKVNKISWYCLGGSYTATSSALPFTA